MSELFSETPLFASLFLAGLLVVSLGVLLYLGQGLRVIYRGLRGDWTFLKLTGTLSFFGKVSDQAKRHYYYDVRFNRDDDGQTVSCGRLWVGSLMRQSNLLQYSHWGTWFFSGDWGASRFKNPAGKAADHYRRLSLLAYWDGRRMHYFQADLGGLGNQELAKVVLLSIISFLAAFIIALPRLIPLVGEEPAFLCALIMGLAPVILWSLLTWLAFLKIRGACLKHLDDFMLQPAPSPKYLAEFSQSLKPIVESQASANERSLAVRFLSAVFQALKSLGLPLSRIWKVFINIAKYPGIFLIFMALAGYYFFLRPLFLMRHIVRPPRFEARPFRLEKIESVKSDKKDSLYLNVTLLLPDSGRVTVAKLIAGPALAQSDLVFAGARGKWFFPAVPLRDGQKLAKFRLLGVERLGRLYADPEEILESCGFDSLTSSLSAFDGLLLSLLALKIFSGALAWNAGLLLTIPAMALFHWLSRQARRRARQAIGQSLRRYFPESEIDGHD